MDEKRVSVPLNLEASYLKLRYWGVFLRDLLSDFDDFGVIRKGIKLPKNYVRILSECLVFLFKLKRNNR